MRSAPRIAVGVVLCILSPTILLFLLGIAESGLYGLSKEWTSGIGVITLLLIIAAAVAIFIIFGSPLDKYDYLEKGSFDLEYGISGMAKEALEAETPACTARITCGVVLCILGAVPLLAASLITDNGLVLMGCLDLLLLMIAAAVYLFITASMRREVYEKLLQKD